MSERAFLTHGGFKRSYLLHKSSGLHRAPLVMMLHGAGGSAELAEEETGWSRLADVEGFAVAYPQGVAVQPERKPKFLTNPQEWNDGSGRGRHDDVGFLDAVLDDLAGSIDKTRVYLTGFSNGAGMVFRYAAERRGMIRAIAPVAGHCWIDPGPIGPLPTYYIVGDSDPLVPLEGGRVVTPWRTVEKRPAVFETLRRWANAIGANPNQPGFKVETIAGHGHHWPGGSALLGRKLGGPVAHGFEATRRIWEFFHTVTGVQ